MCLANILSAVRVSHGARQAPVINTRAEALSLSFPTSFRLANAMLIFGREGRKGGGEGKRGEREEGGLDYLL